jgi:tetratricopeptide (TPR) repeat protein
MNMQSSLEKFITALQEIPQGGDSSIAFLIHSMDPHQGSMLRLCSIPHLFNPAVVQVLDTELTADEAKDICDNFAELAIVIPSDGEMQLHDDAREYLFRQWLDPGQIDSFRRVSARLNEYYEQISISLTGAEKTAATHQAIFHHVGADREAGFKAFEKAYRAARYRFALNECEALINLMHEYDPVFKASQKQWLAYHEGKISVEFRKWEQAEGLFNAILKTETSTALRTRSLYRLGVLHSARRQWESAIAKYSQALNIVREVPEVRDQEHRILEGLANAFREINDLKQAEKLINESIKLAMENEDLSALASSYNSLGNLHRKRGDAKPAIEYFKKSLECLDQFKEVFRKAQLYNNLGLAYADLGQWEDSQKFLESSLELERKAGDTAGQAKALANLGRVYLSQGNEDRAFRVCEESAELSIQIHDWYHAAVVKRNKARVLGRSNRIDEAKKCYVEAIALFNKVKEIDEAEATKKEQEKLGKKKKLPWYAWVAIVLASLFFVLALIGLIGIIGEQL